MTHLFKMTLFGAAFFTTVFILSQLNLANYFPIKTVKVYGINRVDHREMHDVLFPLVSNGFFGINVESIRDRLLQMPWISDLYVRRIWPDQVEVTLIEKKPLARWNKNSLLSEGGELFAPKQETYSSTLPQFIGPNGQQVFMLHYFNNINRLLLPLRAKISYLELTPDFTWKLKLDNGITMQMGHKDILTRLSRFVRVYPKMVGKRAEDVDYVDLRYPNGIAVRWKERLHT